MPDYNLHELADAFYRNFILRDLVTKIVPGTITLASVALCLTTWHDIAEHVAAASFLAWMSAIPFAWVTGLGVQGFGEVIHSIRYSRNEYKSHQDKDANPYSWEEYCLRNGAREEKIWEEQLQNDLTFQENADTRHQHRRERLLAFKEASAITFVSIILLIIPAACHSISYYLSHCIHFMNLLPLRDISAGVSLTQVPHL